jgi:hypothetical protein
MIMLALAIFNGRNARQIVHTRVLSVLFKKMGS